MQRQRGLTLLELLVVLTIIGFVMAGVSLALRDNTQTQIEREAQRLMAILEAARAQSRTSGIALIWQTTPEGFVVRPATNSTMSLLSPRNEAWATVGTQSSVDTVVLGPEPIIAPARITISLPTSNRMQPTASVSIGTDGLQPFQVVP